MEPLRPIDPLIADVERSTGAFCTWQVDDKFINSAFCGSAPAHPVLGELLAGLRTNVEKNDGLRPMYTCGVQYWTNQVKAHHLGKIDVLPSRTAFPYSFTKLHRASEDFTDTGAYMVHHWHNVRSGGNTGQSK
jgi:hypothetical protein